MGSKISKSQEENMKAVAIAIGPSLGLSQMVRIEGGDWKLIK